MIKNVKFVCYALNLFSKNKVVGTFLDMHRGAHNFDVEIYLKDALNMSLKYSKCRKWKQTYRCIEVLYHRNWWDYLHLSNTKRVCQTFQH